MQLLKQNKKLVIPVAVIIVIFSYYFLGGSAVAETLKRPILHIGSNFYGVGNSANSFWTGLTQGAELSNKISNLEKQLAECNYQKYSHEEENEEFPKIKGASVVDAKVSMMPVFGNKRSLLINKGLNDGIFEGAAVMTKEGVFVGKIFSVKERSSSVSLVTELSSTVAISLAKNNEIQAIAKGQGGINLKANLISQNADIQEGDIVITSLLEENTPRGLLVGTITSVYYTEGELFQQADLAPFLSLSSLRRVGVVIPRR